MESDISELPVCFSSVHSWDNLLVAWRKAARGKRGGAPAAHFEANLAEELLTIQGQLQSDVWQPGEYSSFLIHEPKRRLISAAPFRDRVVHHALCNVIEPEFERRFLRDSYANRVGKGTHRAVKRLQTLTRRFAWALRMDVRQHFASIDHELLIGQLAQVVGDPRLLHLCAQILHSGRSVHGDDYRMVFFPGDDLMATLRPRGLPIGNLTSQFWSNCYLHNLDSFVRRTLRCDGYVRYVDDFVLLADSRDQLLEWRAAVIDRLAALRLTVHEGSAQVVPVHHGLPWLGWVVYPTHLHLKGRKVRTAARRLRNRFAAWRAGRISFGEFDASVQGWIEHVRQGDTWGLRGKLLEDFVW